MNELWQRMKIITREDPQMQLFSQLMEGTLKKLERYCSTARPMLNGEVYLSGEEVCSQITAQHTHAPRVQKLRNASFLQNRREDTLQAERHTSHA